MSEKKRLKEIEKEISEVREFIIIREELDKCIASLTDNFNIDIMIVFVRIWTQVNFYLLKYHKEFPEDVIQQTMKEINLKQNSSLKDGKNK